MMIGGMRPEEARVFDKWAGYHSFHSEETQEEYGSFEVFWHDGRVDDPEMEESFPPGWYWHACLPDCLPDGGAEGPFATSRDALEDADEWNPEFDPEEE